MTIISDPRSVKRGNQTNLMQRIRDQLLCCVGSGRCFITRFTSDQSGIHTYTIAVNIPQSQHLIPGPTTQVFANRPRDQSDPKPLFARSNLSTGFVLCPCIEAQRGQGSVLIATLNTLPFHQHNQKLSPVFQNFRSVPHLNEEHILYIPINRNVNYFL